MSPTQFFNQAYQIVAGINKALGQFQYAVAEDKTEDQWTWLILKTDGEEFDVWFLGEVIFSSENELLTDYGTEEHPVLEQLLWDRMMEYSRKLEKLSPMIYANTSDGRGL